MTVSQLFAVAVSLLPVKWQSKAKTIVALLGTLVGVAAWLWPGEQPAWLPVAVMVAMALGVYQTPNFGYVEQPRDPVDPR